MQEQKALFAFSRHAFFLRLAMLAGSGFLFCCQKNSLQGAQGALVKLFAYEQGGNLLCMHEIAGSFMFAKQCCKLGEQVSAWFIKKLLQPASEAD